MEVEEKLKRIEISFRNYIFLLDFLIRETRTELSENRAKRETWLEHHQNWKQSRKVFENVSLQSNEIASEKSAFMENLSVFET
ncbi:hypothetical protein [Leptospira alstonii]|uniref:Uncharacterized protein n=2 Tax=Leptospira alstonii TaxID=28452 RepID=M6CQE0_9LEPT|nr:hypothetical protein [Leptospira alstonii]EMJ94162.1 hypothetical protein LEP1GSC194_0174 [Leptospira alstonii serovar Sichuan str. 79601]EQA79175.1 hypothetical protein LEP1GSC193_2687 [Leptospira alstonii serovar Pingchang str. 80-412]